jgi:cellulose synthase/poly-beta-1,6-N-acetylglucosamine synthase-like glycosyltransferase
VTPGIGEPQEPESYGLSGRKKETAPEISMASETAQIATLIVYYAVLALLAMYGAHRILMVVLYYRHRRNAPSPAGDLTPLPRVTVQLPLYNEVYVAERLIEAVTRLDYPKELLEIQVLDDSTDETRDVARRVVERCRDRGFDIQYVHREERSGFKAGALQAGLAAARGEYLLIFDADFVPGPEILKESLPYFTDPGVGMVQARWEHLNRDFSLLTRIQSIFLDGHFVIEHTARHRSGRFFNFNGTAGIWRRKCLEAVGGWQSDTLTEDLDVSYRAQLAGWRFVYLKDLTVAAELPVDMNGFKSQQHRWTKGSIQTGQKLLPAILKSKFPWKVKAEAFFHLTNNLSYLLVVLLALLIVPAIVIRERIGWRRMAILDFPLFFGATFSFIAFYISSQREIGRELRPTLKYMPFLMSLGIGLSLNNVHAVLEALLDRKTDFTRTPKYSIEGGAGEWRTKKYRAQGNSSLVGEIVLAFYFLGAIIFAIKENYWIGVPFLLIFFNGFAYTAILSFISRWSGASPSSLVPARPLSPRVRPDSP